MKQLILFIQVLALLSGCAMPAVIQTLPAKPARPEAMRKPVKWSKHSTVIKTQESIPVVNLMIGKGEHDA